MALGCLYGDVDGKLELLRVGMRIGQLPPICWRACGQGRHRMRMRTSWRGGWRIFAMHGSGNSCAAGPWLPQLQVRACVDLCNRHLTTTGEAGAVAREQQSFMRC